MDPEDIYIGLTAVEINDLEQAQVLLPSGVSGKCIVSASFLSDASSSSSVSLPSRSCTVAIREQPTRIQGDIEIPVQILSAAMLEFIGLNPDVAQEIFTRWDSRPSPEQNPDELIDYAYAHCNRVNSPAFSTLTDQEIMERIGVSKRLQDALLDSQYQDVYETETLRFWLSDSFRLNYIAVERIWNKLKKHVTVLRRGKEEVEVRRHRSSLFEVSPSSVETPTGSGQSVAATSPPSSSGAALLQPPVEAAIASSSSPSPAPLLKNHQVLYKAMAVENLFEFDEQFIQPDGKVNMRPLMTWAGGDFHPFPSACQYWTKEHETAMKYKGWAEGRAPHSEIWIIRIQVSNEFLQPLQIRQLWYSPNWKEYVWLCRKRGRISGNRELQAEFEEKFASYFQPGTGQTDVISGHICTGVIPKLPKINSANVQADIDETNVMKISDGRKSTQWVVMCLDVAQKLAIEVQGKVHVEVFRARARLDGLS